MAAITELNTGKRTVSRTVPIDMTPLVDLGFLLITFFIFTAKISEAKRLSLVMPADTDIQTPVKESRASSIIIEEGRLHIYKGSFENAVEKNAIVSTAPGEGHLRNWLLERKKETADSLVVIIKPMESASYGMLVDVIDELLICNVARWVIAAPSPEEENKIQPAKAL